MRLLATFTLLVVVLTLAIHNVSASPVEPVQQSDQVNQGQNDLSKGENATCTFFDDNIFTKEKQYNVHKFLTNIVGSDVSCKVTNFLPKLYVTLRPCLSPGVKRELSAVLNSLITVGKTPRPNTGSQDNNFRISNDELNTLMTLLPMPVYPESVDMLKGVVDAISSPSSFFKEFPSTDQFYTFVCG